MSVATTTEETTGDAVIRRSATVTGLCWLLALPGLLWALVRLSGLERGPLVQLVAFTPYVAGWAVVPVLVAGALRRWQAAVAAGVAALALIGVVAPRALPGGGRPAGGPTLRVATANMLMAAGDAAAIVELVRAHRVDVLALQEFSPETQAALDRAGLAALLPHRHVNAEVGTTGSALYARFPLTDTGIRRNLGGFGFTQAYGKLLVPGGPAVLVESAHPMSPYALATVPDWFADLRAQPRATPDGPLRVLAGDFNATLDHAPLRRLLDSGYVDAAAAVGQGLTGTWGPYDGDLIPPVTIDHVLVDRRIGVTAVSVHPVPGSDHRAVLAELTLPRG